MAACDPAQTFNNLKAAPGSMMKLTRIPKAVELPFKLARQVQ